MGLIFFLDRDYYYYYPSMIFRILLFIDLIFPLLFIFIIIILAR